MQIEHVFAMPTCFALQVYFKELPGSQEMSLEYKFRIAPQVPTRDFFVAIHLIYEDVGGGGYYSNTVFNGTIEVVEKPKLVDTEGIFMYAMILATFGAVGKCQLLLKTTAVHRIRLRMLASIAPSMQSNRGLGSCYSIVLLH